MDVDSTTMQRHNNLHLTLNLDLDLGYLKQYKVVILRVHHSLPFASHLFRNRCSVLILLCSGAT